MASGKTEATGGFAAASGGTWLSLGSYEEVYNSDMIYWEIKKDLKSSGMELVKILKLHSSHLEDRFEEEVNLVKKSRNQDFVLNIRDLYHGTSESVDKICNEGLDQRLSSKGHFGQGIYFSNIPELCRIESEARSPKDPFIIRCRVILGDCKRFEPDQSDPSLTREPVKDSVSGKTYYHSVEGRIGKYDQFVVYERRRVNVQYVIYYTCQSPLPTLPPIPSVSKSSSKKKRRKSVERRASSSSENGASDNERRSSGSRTEHRRPSRESSDEKRFTGSSGDEEEEDESARRKRRPSLDGSLQYPDEPKENMIAAPPEVPKAVTTRNRTHRLMESVSPATDTASGVTRSSTGSTGAPDTPSDTYKREVQETALKHLLDLKDKVEKPEMDELWNCYNRTYGLYPGSAGYQSSAVENLLTFPLESENDDVQLVIDTLVEEFQNIVGYIDPQVARSLIIQSEMDLNAAVFTYYDGQ